MIPQLSVKGLKNLEKAIGADKTASKKALVTAIKVTGFNLRRQMMQEVRAGAPGGLPFAPLSFIRRGASGRLRADRPYAMPHGVRGAGGPTMVSMIRYNIEKQEPFTLAVGWSGPRISASYRRRAIALQKGFTSPVSQRQRKYFARIGDTLGQRRQARKYFFLRKTTERMTTPARPVIDPFWAAHQQEAWGEIRNNFRRKLRGERI